MTDRGRVNAQQSRNQKKHLHVRLQEVTASPSQREATNLRRGARVITSHSNYGSLPALFEAQRKHFLCLHVCLEEKEQKDNISNTPPLPKISLHLLCEKGIFESNADVFFPNENLLCSSFFILRAYRSLIQLSVTFCCCI